jgi:pyruvate kinase
MRLTKIVATIGLIISLFLFLFLFQIQKKKKKNQKKKKIKKKIKKKKGPGVDNREKIRELILAGVNVFRLNFSHAIHEKMILTIKNIRTLSHELNIPVGILADLQGPKFRNYYLKGHEKVTLKEEALLRFRTCENDDDWGDAQTITTKNEILVRTLSPGNRVLLCDGAMELTVTQRIGQDELECKVVRGGVLGEKKGINVPDIHLDIYALTDKDKKDCAFALEQKVDFIALSFVQKAEDMTYLKDFIRQCKCEMHANNSKSSNSNNKSQSNFNYNNEDDPWLIAKIERPQALDMLESILSESDGIMVARGDLGVEIPLARVPLEQKRMIALANEMGKLVITATQMLESMIENSVPTRAEVSDVANAIFDGTDAIMLSGEVAVGKYPVVVVKTMGEIALEAEKGIDHHRKSERLTHEHFKSKLASVPRSVVTEAAQNCRNDEKDSDAANDETGVDEERSSNNNNNNKQQQQQQQLRFEPLGCCIQCGELRQVFEHARNHCHFLFRIHGQKSIQAATRPSHFGPDAAQAHYAQNVSAARCDSNAV